MKKLIDIVTVAALLAAFALAFLAGFVFKNGSEPYLSTGILSLISIAGMGVLFGFGSVSAFVTRVKNKQVPIAFLILFVLETVAFVAMTGGMIALLCKLFTLESWLIRGLFIAAALLIIGGYVDSVALANKQEATENEADDKSAEIDE